VSTWTAWRHRRIVAITRACWLTAVTMATSIPGWSGLRTLWAASVACTSTIFCSRLVLVLDLLAVPSLLSLCCPVLFWSIIIITIVFFFLFLFFLVLILVLVLALALVLLPLPLPLPLFFFFCSCACLTIVPLSVLVPLRFCLSRRHLLVHFLLNLLLFLPTLRLLFQPFSAAVVYASCFSAARSALFWRHKHRRTRTRAVVLWWPTVLTGWRHWWRQWDHGSCGRLSRHDLPDCVSVWPRTTDAVVFVSCLIDWRRRTLTFTANYNCGTRDHNVVANVPKRDR